MASGDGRYYSKPAIQIIIKMAAANGVRSLWVTFAASAVAAPVMLVAPHV